MQKGFMAEYLEYMEEDLNTPGMRRVSTLNSPRVGKRSIGGIVVNLASGRSMRDGVDIKMTFHQGRHVMLAILLRLEDTFKRGLEFGSTPIGGMTGTEQPNVTTPLKIQTTHGTLLKI